MIIFQNYKEFLFKLKNWEINFIFKNIYFLNNFKFLKFLGIFLIEKLGENRYFSKFHVLKEFLF